MKTTKNLSIEFNEKTVTENGKYRLCVGALIEKNGLFFCATRLDNLNSDHQETLQFPQGGVDSGELMEVAIFREIQEETGIAKNNLDFIQRSVDFVKYKVPKDFLRFMPQGKIGQVQIWYHFKFTGTESDINISQEGHRELGKFFFKNIDEIIEKSIFFKRELYLEIKDIFGL